MVGVAPMATAGAEGIPLKAIADVLTVDTTGSLEKPNSVMAAALGRVIEILESSPVVPDDKLKILFTVS